MKKTLSLILVLVLLVGCFAACGSEEKNANTTNENSSQAGVVKKNGEKFIYNNVDFSKYVELCDYKKINVDTASNDFKELYNEALRKDAVNNNFYTEETLSSGKIEKGDIANIDYVGKKDGVAFEGGTADAHDLEIGSGSFIEGFEEGLIGVSIGQTVDLNLTFPANYHSADLAGKDVVFTVKVNSAKRKNLQKPEQYYSSIGFKTVDEYLKDVNNRTIENYLLNYVMTKSKILDYPQDDVQLIFNTTKAMLEKQLNEYYGVDFATYLAAVGQTEDQFIESQIIPTVNYQMVLYAIFDAEKMSYTQEDFDAEVDYVLKKSNDSTLTRDKVIEKYGDAYFEEKVVTVKVLDLIRSSANIK